jgi:hypothetical protein
MFRTRARVSLAAVVALTVLFSLASPVYAGGFDAQAEDPAVAGGNWFQAVLTWLGELFAPEAEPGQPMDHLTAGAGGPTGPCIDPLGGGGRADSGFCE